MKISKKSDYGFIWISYWVFTNGSDSGSLYNEWSTTDPWEGSWQYQGSSADVSIVVKSNTSSTADYIVSGAGTTSVNGNYVVDTSTEYTAYKNTETDVYLWFNAAEGDWVFSPSIGSSYTDWYYSVSVVGGGGSSDDPTQGTYYTGDMGTAPVPTVIKKTISVETDNS